ILNDGKKEQFFGVTQDIEYLADWIDTFISRNERWNSPKYLVGESYGTTRVSGLADQLQSRNWMHLNGVILVSECGLGLELDGAPVRSKVLKLPYYATTAWFHEKLSPELQNKGIAELQSEVEKFTLEEVLPAVSYG